MIFTKRFLITTALSVATTVLSAYRPEAGEKFDKARYVAQRIKDDVLPILDRYKTTRHVEVPNDATNWFLFISHAGVRPSGALNRMFETDPRLRDFWNNPHVTAAYTGPAYRGWREQAYAGILSPPGILLTDATGKRIYLARGTNVPTTATTLVAEINKAVAEYHEGQLKQSINTEADELARKVEAGTPIKANLPEGYLLPNEASYCEGPIRGLVRFVLRRRDGTPRPIYPWNWGRRPCPDCPDDPIDNTPVYEPQPEIVDNADEGNEDTPLLTYLLAVLLGGGGGFVYKTYKEIA